MALRGRSSVSGTNLREVLAQAQAARTISFRSMPICPAYQSIQSALVQVSQDSSMVLLATQHLASVQASRSASCLLNLVILSFLTPRCRTVEGQTTVVIRRTWGGSLVLSYSLLYPFMFKAIPAIFVPMVTLRFKAIQFVRCVVSITIRMIV